MDLRHIVATAIPSKNPGSAGSRGTARCRPREMPKSWMISAVIMTYIASPSQPHLFHSPSRIHHARPASGVGGTEAHTPASKWIVLPGPTKLTSSSDLPLIPDIMDTLRRYAKFVGLKINLLKSAFLLRGFLTERQKTKLTSTRNPVQSKVKYLGNLFGDVTLMRHLPPT